MNITKGPFRSSLTDNSKEYEHFESLLQIYFDEQFYLESNPDVKETGINPLVHYMNWGWKEGRDPSRIFCTESYLTNNPDVKSSNINPLLHFVKYGIKELRKPTLSNNNTIHSSLGYTQANKSYLGSEERPNYTPRIDLPLKKDNASPKTIAFYLPQFHPFTENDTWWGKGFTEWTNVAKAIPQFKDHYQPRLPSDLGYYDLRVPEVFEEQISMAKDYGVDGFCFHYYWFAGHRLMEKPLEAYLENKDLDHPFCLCWANENWTRRWDGSEHDILMAQEHSPEDNKNVFFDLLRYFKDSRYITVDGKPMIVVYRPSIIPNIADMAKQWNELAIQEGFPGLHLVATNSFGFNDFNDIGFDAIVEFPPHNVSVASRNENVELFNANFEGQVFEYGDVVEYSLGRLNALEKKKSGGNYYPTMMTSWDNSARKPAKGNIFHNASPDLFRKWYEGAYRWSQNNHNVNEQFVFINAWNEWAEGTYLEPDKKYGYAYLTAIRSTQYDLNKTDTSLQAYAKNIAAPKSSDCVIVAHIFYEDLVEEFCDAILQAKSNMTIDVAISIPKHFSLDKAKRLVQKLNPVKLLVVDNRGRDVLPFLRLLKELVNLNYVYGLKIHSKKSTHLSEGNEWRKSIISGLLNYDVLKKISELFSADNTGIVAPESSFFELSPDVLLNNTENIKKLELMYGVSLNKGLKFVGGTMFWFRFDALKCVLQPSLNNELFGPENGAIDGTMAHAYERYFTSLAAENGFEIIGIGNIKVSNPYSEEC